MRLFFQEITYIQIIYDPKPLASPGILSPDQKMGEFYMGISGNGTGCNTKRSLDLDMMGEPNQA